MASNEEFLQDQTELISPHPKDSINERKQHQPTYLSGVVFHVDDGEGEFGSGSSSNAFVGGADGDVDEDGAGLFVSRPIVEAHERSLTRHGSSRLGRQYSIEMSEILARGEGGGADAESEGGVGGHREGQTALDDQLLSSTMGASEPTGEGELDRNAHIWLMELPALQDKFPQSGLNLDDGRKSVGLSSEDAAALLLKHGPNQLTPPDQVPAWLRFAKHLADPLGLLLVVAGILSIGVAYPLDTSQKLNLYLGIVLIALVLFNATYAFVQEGTASNVMNSFKKMLAPAARVCRDGRIVSIDSTHIVPGDVLVISGGEIIPADMRVIWTQDCKVETSSLTGESLPLTCSLRSDGVAKIEQARNICFNSSKCLEGEVIGVVFACGDRTLIGQIASMAGTGTVPPSPLQVEMTLFVQRIAVIAMGLATIFFVIAGARTGDWLASFINVFIVVLVALIPQGLPLTVISQLTVMSRKMAKRNVLVKELRSVETLGSCTVIATDKTGTLTQNKMTVANMWIDMYSFSATSVMQNFPAESDDDDIKRFETSDTRSENERKRDRVTLPSTIALIERIAVICSKAHFADERQLTPDEVRALKQMQSLRQDSSKLTWRTDNELSRLLQSDSSLTVRSGRAKLLAELGRHMRDDGAREVVGDASETALFNFVRQRQSIELLRQRHRVIYSQPFNSRTKYALAVVESRSSDSVSSRMVLMKGAPELLLNRCTHFARNGVVELIDEDFKEQFDRSYKNFASRGERVLGFAMIPLPADGPSDQELSATPELVPTQGLVFVGLVSLIDPPKATVPDAVLACHRAGVKVIMVTGDHPLTASAIARQVNIFQSGNLTREEAAEVEGCTVDEVNEDDVKCVAVSGNQLDGFSEEDWSYTLSKPNIVFARTTPSQKLAIVERLQKLGHIVAVTGDGVNDAPALKKADIGCAMGISGSDVARDAADVVIFDDDFASIVVGIRLGRTIFDNITKTICYTMSHIGPELAPVLIGIAFRFPLAISSLMILSIDLFTELAPAISMAYEPPESNIMDKKPRNAKRDHLAGGKVLSYAFLQAGLIEVICGYLGFFLVFDWYGVSFTSLFNTDYFQGDENLDMPPFPGCRTLADRDELPFPKDSVCYNADDQQEVLMQAQTCYYALVVLGQFFHIWLMKTRTVSIFRHGLLRNEMTIPAVIIELCLLLLFILPPSSKDIIFTSPFPPRFWALLVISPVLLFIWQEGRKAIVRRHPKSFIARYIHW